MVFGIFEKKLESLNKMIDENRIDEVKEELLKHRVNVGNDQKTSELQFVELVKHIQEYKRSLDKAIEDIDNTPNRNADDAKIIIGELVKLDEKIISVSNSLIATLKKEEKDIE